MPLNGNFLCRRICKTLSGVCKVSAWKIFCTIPWTAAKVCMVHQPTNSLLRRSPALNQYRPNHLQCQLESVLSFITASYDLLENSNCYFIFLLLGVNVVLMRSVMPGKLHQLTVQPGSSPQTFKKSSEALQLYISLLKMLLSPAEWANGNDTEIWAYSGFTSSSQVKGWSQRDLWWCWKGLGSNSVPAARTWARDGAQGRNVPSQPGRRGTAPWEPLWVQFICWNLCETALIMLQICLYSGAASLQPLGVDWAFISIGRVGRTEVRLVSGGFQSICSSLPLFILCIKLSMQEENQIQFSIN